MSIRCLKCGRSAGAIYRAPSETICSGIYWACGECGGTQYAPEERAVCVNCGRTETETSEAVLARSGLKHHEVVMFPNATPS